MNRISRRSIYLPSHFDFDYESNVIVLAVKTGVRHNKAISVLFEEFCWILNHF